MNIKTLITTLALAGLAVSTALAANPAFNVSNGNSTFDVTIDPTLSQSSTGNDGMFNWTVDRVDNLYRQWFYVGVQNPTSGAWDVRSLSSYNFVGGGISGLDNNNLQLRFNNATANTPATWTVDISYNLLGGLNGSGVADIQEGIRIVGAPGAQSTLRFFQYSDFDLNNTVGGQYSTATVVTGTGDATTWGSGAVLSETIVQDSSTGPNRYEANSFTQVFSQIMAGQLLNNAAFGPGDAAWAFEWDLTIGGANGSSYIISKDKIIKQVPDAGATVAMLGLAMAGLAMMRRRFVK